MSVKTLKSMRTGIKSTVFLLWCIFYRSNQKINAIFFVYSIVMLSVVAAIRRGDIFILYFTGQNKSVQFFILEFLFAFPEERGEN